MSNLKIRPMVAIILSVILLIATVLYMLTIGSAQLPLPHNRSIRRIEPKLDGIFQRDERNRAIFEGVSGQPRKCR